MRHNVLSFADGKDGTAQRYVILVQYVSVGTICDDQMEMVSCCQNTTCSVVFVVVVAFFLY